MDGPAILGSKGDQMWKYMVQWMLQLSKVVRGPNMAVYSAMDDPACKGGQMWQYIQYNGLSRYYR